MPVIDAMAKRLARLGLPPYTGCIPLANLHPRGYVSPDARIAHDGFVRGRHCFIGDGVLVYREEQGGEVRLGDHVHIHENNSLQTGQGGSIAIGSNTHIQPRCQFSGYKGSISIGARVEIAPACAFYPYNHGMAIGIPIQQQPIFSRSGIFIGDDAWLGYGVIVLDGAWIGNGAIIAAGAVVSGDIPENAIAAGVPARVIAARQ
jgi:acetyltransferase-like isoleucine patch superfamily enzyme